jgi:endonuclease-3 related protein
MSRNRLKKETIRRVFRQLEAAMGPQHWWPAGSSFEVVAGAYLTQNTAWTNVEQAMENLLRAGALSVEGLRGARLEELETLVRPAGYFRQKAARLKMFVAHLDAHYSGSLEKMLAQPTERLRHELLGLAGIGPETADSILLYAASHEVFVVDTYTRRIFERHGLVNGETTYEEIRLAVQGALAEEQSEGQRQEQEQEQDPDQEQGQLPHPPPKSGRKDGAPSGTPSGAPEYTSERPRLVVHAPSVASRMERSELSQRYNEFHALIVQTAKHFCVKGEPKCEECPLRYMLPRKR